MKKEIIVYRIEHRKVRNEKNNHFCGPYGISEHVDSSKWSDSDHDVDAKPAPWEDELLFKNMNKKRKLCSWHKEFICGFKSMRQLSKWFSKTEFRYKKLIKANYL